MRPTRAKRGPGAFAPTIFEFLRLDATTGGLLPAAERLAQLQQDLHPLLPAGSTEACVIHLTGESTVVIKVASAALAGKLRQMVPTLQTGLTRRGWKISAIQVRTQPMNSYVNSMGYDKNTQAPKNAHIPQQALAEWEALAGTLEQSPLQEAVNRLIRHHRARNAQE